MKRPEMGWVTRSGTAALVVIGAYNIYSGGPAESWENMSGPIQRLIGVFCLLTAWVSYGQRRAVAKILEKLG